MFLLNVLSSIKFNNTSQGVENLIIIYYSLNLITKHIIYKNEYSNLIVSQYNIRECMLIDRDMFL